MSKELPPSLRERMGRGVWRKKTVGRERKLACATTPDELIQAKDSREIAKIITAQT